MRPWCRTAIALLTLTGLFTRAQPACADQIILTGGDRISGRILSVTRDAVRIETRAAGIIQISRHDVERLDTDNDRVVDLVSGERIVGRIIADAANSVTVRSLVLGERRVPLDAIDAISDLDAVPLTQVRGRGTASPGAPPQGPAPSAPTQGPPTIGQEPEAPDDIRKVFLRQATVLLNAGQVEVEGAFNYLHTQSVSSILNARFRQFQLPLASRVGLFDRAEGFVSVGVTSVRQDLGFADNVLSHHEAGIGDVTAGFNYELMRETASGPDMIASVAVGAPTGSKPNEQGLSLGTGHWATRLGVQFIRTVDPVALFAGASYQHEFDARYFLGDGVHEIDQGETAGYNFGFGFAVNDNISLSVQVIGSYQSEAKADGQRIFASSREPVSLRYALTYRRSQGTYVEPSVIVGLDDDAPNFALGMSLTHRFGK